MIYRLSGGESNNMGLKNIFLWFTERQKKQREEAPQRRQETIEELQFDIKKAKLEKELQSLQKDDNKFDKIFG